MSKATTAKKNTEREGIIEQARTDVLGYQAENKGGNLEKSQLKSVLDTYFKDVPTVEALPDGDELLNLPLTTLEKYGTHTIKVSEIYNGKLSKAKTSKKLTEIVKNTDYGKSIDYSVKVNGKTVNNWKVFLNDGNNVYIILGEFLEASLVPSEAELDTDPANRKYSVGVESEDRNKLLTGLTTSSYWKDFAMGINGATATGTPTLEQLEESYGQSPLYYETVVGDLYVLPADEENKCYCYWLATPDPDLDDSLVLVLRGGQVEPGDVYGGATTIGIRPLIKLPNNLTGSVDTTVTIDK